MRRARLPEVIRLARLFIHGIEVVTFLRRVIGMRRRHHEMTAVDDLRLAAVRFLKRETRLGLRIVVQLDGYRGGASVRQHFSNSHGEVNADVA